MSSLTSARMTYAAVLVGSVTYGMYVIIAGISIRFLLRRGRRQKRSQQQTAMQVILWYTIAMLTVSTIYYITASNWSELVFVEATVKPALLATVLSTANPLVICKTTAFIVNIWLADSLIIYRLYCLWQYNMYVTVLPLVVLCGTVACGIASLIQTANPNGSLQQPSVADLTVPTYALSVALNVMCTSLICYQLWHYHRRLQSINHKSKEYASVAVILIESAAAYSITGLVYIPLLAKNITWSYPIGALWGSVTVIYPQIIILRIALGIDILATSGSAGDSLPSFNGQASKTQIGGRSLPSVGPIAKASPAVWINGKSQRNAAQVIDMKPMNLTDATSNL